MQSYFDYSDDVLHAVKNKKPLLALESTIITHGMPYPENIKVAKMVEQIARDAGVTPATIAILDGRIKIGLNENDLEKLVANNTTKASKRDLPFLLHKKASAGTTVAATMYLAHCAGIKVFATGGIGGVHRGDDMDISADLTELAQTPVTVICAGAKAILDLGRTLEYLETLSVPIIGFRTQVLPAFYTAKTDYQLDAHTDNMADLAEIIRIQRQLKLSSGMLVVTPIDHKDEIPKDILEPVIADAINAATKEKISGKEITPFLLSNVVKATSGKSLAANIALIKNNVKLGAELAKMINGD